MKHLLLEYKKKKYKIKKRLREFRKLNKADKKDIFAELCFCILTPQSKALNCDRAIKELKKKDLLFKGTKDLIKTKLKGVRFPNNKASYLICARTLLNKDNIIDMQKKLKIDTPFDIRDWLVKNVKGLGYKEASHFLRNIGLGRNLAILDVHILKNLKRYGIIRKTPKTINKSTYIDIENKMKMFSKKINIPLEELDLLFWSNETGIIFK